MVATENQVKPQSAAVADESDVKPTFNAHSFAQLILRMNRDPDLLCRDWREIVRDEFRLAGEQAQSLFDVSEERSTEIRLALKHFAEHIRRGAVLAGRIIKRPPEDQTPDAVHGIQLELLPGDVLQTAQLPQMLRIAHCDANCRNWKWNSW